MHSLGALRVGVVVVAAGSGARLAMAQPKAFVPLDGVTLLERALHSVFSMTEPAQVVIVAPASHLQEASAIGVRCAGEAAELVTVVAGGATRHASVELGLAQLYPSIKIVLVHDSARALTPPDIFDSVIAGVVKTGGGIVPALPLVDSIKRVNEAGDVLGDVNRAELAASQTPQGFPRAELDRAYKAAANADFTDDAAVFIAAGNVVRTVPGNPRSFKITTAWDVNRARQLLTDTSGQGALEAERGNSESAGVSRIGMGVDVHSFGANDNLWLAGLHWPGEKELSGHSDGDAVAHALCDALLAAAGLGDIGGVFGTSAPEFAHARGEVFVRETIRLLAVAGWEPVHASVQIVGNRPIFSPRRLEAQSVVSEWVGAPVSLSATTTDGLGFTGRGEGIAALATALVRPRR